MSAFRPGAAPWQTMSPTQQQSLPLDLAAGVSGRSVTINARCSLRCDDDLRVVLVGGVPHAAFSSDDRAAAALAMVTLVEQGHARQVEVASAFGCATRTVRRHQKRFLDGGLGALGRSPGFPKGQRRVSAARVRLIHKLKAQGVSNRAIAKRFGITEKAVRKQLRRIGWREPPTAQIALPLEDADARGAVSRISPPVAHAQPAEPALIADPNVSSSDDIAASPLDPKPLEAPSLSTFAPAIGAGTGSVDPSPSADPNQSAADDPGGLPLFSLDRDPADRTGDRLLACLGLLDDAAPLFRPGKRVPRAGVLLAMPSVGASGIFDIADTVYGSIGPAFYGLRTSMVAMLVMALLRIKRPEALKEHPPDDIGRLLGLDRAPEVKTLRRKLTRLASLGRATQFGQQLSARRSAALGEMLGFLYVDGHVRVYHGNHEIPKAHVARMRIAMAGTTDYWVHDAAGDPLFVVTAEANDGLTKMLPPLLEQMRALVGERRVTVVFDRGGWSLNLFQQIRAAGFDFITYRKGPIDAVDASLFAKREATFHGRKVEYVLADQTVTLLRGKLSLRQVTRLTDNGHQTSIVTTRTDIADTEVAFRMFERWHQENFFKYMREEFALDALSDHRTEPADPAREVPNPRWHELDAELHGARTLVEQLAILYGVDAFEKMTAKSLALGKTKAARELSAAIKKYVALRAKRDATPKRVPVQATSEAEVVRLATERKHLTNVLKMVAYQAESDLVRAIEPHYKRAGDEGRTLVQSILASPADIEVTSDALRITLAPLSSAHRTHVACALCDELNRRDARFPGTRLRLRFGVVLPPTDADSGRTAEEKSGQV